MAPPSVDPAFAVAVGASTALKTLLASLQTLLACCDALGSWATFGLQAQVMRRGDALAAAMVAYAQSQKLSPESLELLPFLNSLANVLWHTLDRRMTVVVDVERDSPALFVDAAALEEALIRIVDNAQSAMPHGGRLVLRGACDRQDSRFLNLDVIDNGLGMSPDVAKQAASPFFTAKEVRNGPTGSRRLCGPVGRPDEHFQRRGTRDNHSHVLADSGGSSPLIATAQVMRICCAV